MGRLFKTVEDSDVIDDNCVGISSVIDIDNYTYFGVKGCDLKTERTVLFISIGIILIGSFISFKFF